MNEDFTEEEDFDELPEGVEFAEPAPTKKPVAAPVPTPAPRQPRQPKQETRGRPPQRRQLPPAAAEAPKERYSPYLMPTRVGVIDNETNQPVMEDQEINALMLGLITKLLNDVDDIKKNL